MIEGTERAAAARADLVRQPTTTTGVGTRSGRCQPGPLSRLPGAPATTCSLQACRAPHPEGGVAARLVTPPANPTPSTPPRTTMTTTVLGHDLSILDRGHIDRVARCTAHQLTHCAAAVAVLTPGDATLYEITLTRAADDTIVVDPDQNRIGGIGSTGRHWHTVAISCSGGIPYRADLRFAADGGYVLSHWFASTRGRPSMAQAWTAAVLTLFLEALAIHWNATDEAGEIR